MSKFDQRNAKLSWIDICQRESESLVRVFLRIDNLNNYFEIFPQIYLNNNPDIFPQIPPKLFQLFKHNIQLDLWDILLLGKGPPLLSKWPRRAYKCYILLGVLWPFGPRIGCMSVGVYIDIVNIVPTIGGLYFSCSLHQYCMYNANNWGDK